MNHPRRRASSCRRSARAGLTTTLGLALIALPGAVSADPIGESCTTSPADHTIAYADYPGEYDVISPGSQYGNPGCPGCWVVEITGTANTLPSVLGFGQTRNIKKAECADAHLQIKTFGRRNGAWGPLHKDVIVSGRWIDEQCLLAASAGAIQGTGTDRIRVALRAWKQTKVSSTPLQVWMIFRGTIF